jgi:hypothetical protein
MNYDTLVPTRSNSNIDDIICSLEQSLGKLGSRFDGMNPFRIDNTISNTEKNKYMDLFYKWVLRDIKSGMQSNDTLVGNDQDKGLIVIREAALRFIQEIDHGSNHNAVARIVGGIIDNIDALRSLKRRIKAPNFSGGETRYRHCC